MHIILYVRLVFYYRTLQITIRLANTEYIAYEVAQVLLKLATAYMHAVAEAWYAVIHRIM